MWRPRKGVERAGDGHGVCAVLTTTQHQEVPCEP
jgi:hypothetical protein